MQDFGKIIQMIPCAVKTRAVFADSGKLDSVDDVRYLALTDTGDIYGLVCSDGYHEIADRFGNFCGLCEGQDLAKYMEDNEITEREDS